MDEIGLETMVGDGVLFDVVGNHDGHGRLSFGSSGNQISSRVHPRGSPLVPSPTVYLGAFRIYML